MAYKFEDIELDERRAAVSRQGRPVKLSPTEFALLHALMRNVGRVMSKEELLDAVWGYRFAGDANILQTYVSYLRRKLGADGASLVQTVRGVGYRLGPDR